MAARRRVSRRIRELTEQVARKVEEEHPSTAVKVDFDTMYRDEDAYLWLYGDSETIEEARITAANLIGELMEKEEIFFVPRGGGPRVDGNRVA